jgi:hypothetical protein
VNPTRAQVELSPDISTHEPISRQQEAEYWPYAAYWSWGAMPVIVPPDPLIRAKVEERRRADQAGVDAHPRSSQVVRGYHIQASDDSIGHVADFLFDEDTLGDPLSHRRYAQLVTRQACAHFSAMDSHCELGRSGVSRGSHPQADREEP